MSGTLRLRGATSGYSELQAPAVAADQTFVLPTAGGTLLTTDSPVAKLTLQLGSASQPSLTFEGDTDTGLYSSGTNTLNLVTGGSDRLVIDSSGNVGIGTSSPSSKLHALNPSGGSATTEVSTIERDNSGYFFKLYRNAGSGNVGGLLGADSAGTYFTGGHNTNNMLYIDAGNGVMQFYTNSSEQMRIDSSGNVGIGTTSPTVLLDLESTSPTIRLTDSDATGTPECQISGAGGDLVLEADRDNEKSDSLIRLQVDGSERMRINSSGNVGIGTASPGSESFVVERSGSTPTIRINAASTYEAQLKLQADGTVTDTQLVAAKTDGSLAFARWTGAAYSERMRIDSSGNVGIGESSPNTKLVVKDASNGLTDSVGNINVISSDSAAIDKGGSIGLGGFYNGTSNSIPFANIHGKKENSTGNNAAGYFAVSTRNASAGTVERMRITSAGNVGIGTTSPSVPLHVIGNQLFEGDMDISPPSSSSEGGQITLRNPGGSTTGATIDISVADVCRIFQLNNNSILELGQLGGTGGIIKFATAGSERMQIDSSGNVGIGVTTPQNRIHIASSGANPAYLHSTNSSSGSGASDGVVMGLGNALDVYYWNYENGAQIWATNGTERMRIRNDGQILFGSSSSTFNVLANQNVAAKMHLSGAGSGSGNIEIYGASHSTDPKIITFNTDSSERMRIRSDGHVLIGTTTFGGSGGFTLRNDGLLAAPSIYSTVVTGARDMYMDSSGYFGYISSVRESKSNIQVQDNVDWLYQLEPVTFNYKTRDRETGEYTGNVESELEYGLIAEDVEAVCSDLCFYDETDDGPELRGVSYKKLITPMLKALQDAKAEIDTLKAKVAALEATSPTH